MTIAAVLGSKGHEVETLSGESTLMDAVRTLAAKRIGALPVMEGEKIVGIISERDVIYCLSSKGPDALAMAVSEAMSAPAITAEQDVGVMSALALMTKRRIRHLPIVESDGAVCGIVSIGDLVKHRMERIEAEAEAMRTYIQSA